jgi:hypothetical protein
MPTTEYRSQAARDAAQLYGASYCEYLDTAAQERADYFNRHDQPELAREMFTRSLGEALAGNKGD